MSPHRQTGSLLGRDLAAKRALHEAQHKLLLVHQGRLSAVASVEPLAFSALSIMISFAALLCAITSLAFVWKYLVVIVVGTAAIIVWTMQTARARARRIQAQYVQEHLDLFSCAPRLELVSWLLGQPK